MWLLRWGRGINLRWKALSFLFVPIVEMINGVVPTGVNGFLNELDYIFCKGYKNKQWLVSSLPWLQRHLSERVSIKLGHLLWHLKELRPTFSVCQKYYFSLDESSIKYDF